MISCDPIFRDEAFEDVQAFGSDAVYPSVLEDKG